MMPAAMLHGDVKWSSSPEYKRWADALKRARALEREDKALAKRVIDASPRKLTGAQRTLYTAIQWICLNDASLEVHGKPYASHCKAEPSPRDLWEDPEPEPDPLAEAKQQLRVLAEELYELMKQYHATGNWASTADSARYDAIQSEDVPNILRANPDLIPILEGIGADGSARFGDKARQASGRLCYSLVDAACVEVTKKPYFKHAPSDPFDWSIFE